MNTGSTIYTLNNAPSNIHCSATLNIQAVSSYKGVAEFWLKRYPNICLFDILLFWFWDLFKSQVYSSIFPYLEGFPNILNILFPSWEIIYIIFLGGEETVCYRASIWP